MLSSVGALDLGIALSLLAALALLVRLPRRDVRSPALALLRSLFPAWRFFEALDPGPLLSYRVALPDGSQSAWLAALPPPEPHRLLLNARGNLRLACQSLVEQFASELAAGPAVPEQLVSFWLVDALVQDCVVRAHADAQRYQFRLSAREPVEHELFVSNERTRRC